MSTRTTAPNKHQLLYHLAMTVKPITKNGATQWRVSFYSAGKQRRFFFKDKSEADAFAKSKEDERRMAGSFWLDLPASARLKAIEAIAKARAGGFELLHAVEFYAEHQGGALMSGVTVGKAIQDCVKSKRDQGVSARYLNELGYTLGKFATHFGKRMVNSIKAKEIEGWLNNGNGWSATTRKGYRVDVQTLFSFAEKHEWVSKNPVKAVPVPMVDYKAPGILSVKSSEMLMITAAELDPGMCGYLSLGLFAGVRPSELLRLTTSAVDLDEKLVEITQGKNRRQRRIVRLTDNCVAWCRLGMNLPPADWQGRLEKIREKAGLLRNWPHDAMRHSYCTYALPILGSAATALNAGHSEAILFKHYADRVKPKVAECFFRILP